jgi:hypothetical protein
MSEFLRRGGRATRVDGTELAWSVADGRRGRRWRAITTRDGAVIATLLLEVGADGRPARLELATAAGLLTLHPAGTASLHGNAVTAGGVRHFTFDWSDDHALAIDGMPIGEAVTARRLADATTVGEGRTVPVVAVAPDLFVREGTLEYVRLDETTWRIQGAGERAPHTLAIDDRGLLVWPGGAGDWPLERDASG